MSIQLSTAGVTMKYAVEATSGTRPTKGYTEVPELKAIPEMNPEPDTLETTNLKETEYKTYIAGLKDLGGALGFTINLTKDSLAAWSTMVEAYDEAAGEGKAMWFCIDVPGLAKDLFFTGQPTPLGLPGMEVNNVLEATAYITPTNAPVWDAKLSEV